MPTPVPDQQLLTTGLSATSALIVERCARWTEAAGTAFDEVLIASRLVIDATRQDKTVQVEAVVGVFAQAVSDYMDLLIDASSGRGRPALRAARTLVEEQVAVLDCANDLQAAARWLDSSPTANVATGTLALPERYLRGKTLQQYRHHVGKRARAAAGGLAAAISQWGNRFQVQWHGRSMRQRMETYGLEDAYEFYRLASAPVHATNAGSLGLRQERKAGPVIRTGFALEPVPVAVLYGTAAMRAVLVTVESLVTGGLATALAALDHLDEQWEELYVGMRGLDRELWPAELAPNRVAVLIVDVDGSLTCFEYLPEIDKARPIAYPLSVTQDVRQIQAVGSLLDQLAEGPHPRIAVFIHEARADPPPRAPFERAQFTYDTAIHISVDGTVGIPHGESPDDD